jgi:hypothetical protein
LILHGDIVLHHGAVRPRKNGSLRVNFCRADGHPSPLCVGYFAGKSFVIISLWTACVFKIFIRNDLPAKYSF